MQLPIGFIDFGGRFQGKPSNCSVKWCAILRKTRKKKYFPNTQIIIHAKMILEKSADNNGMISACSFKIKLKLVRKSFYGKRSTVSKTPYLSITTQPALTDFDANNNNNKK